ncbi:CDP-diacylglycerol--glycerol-3-phosphate 3-phosphatidyltransferase [Puniceicoccus vermicola]|uniref:CDP-diacylglycerol--glycerol-3-phosphate 3-phosphatidyltransferase n=1 Tax=Puniceicoccus vermicola TaxID=388746 RepID=A0A7X1E2X6_9BACT|nr:CDP-diacylglycerol--glycerol-3-phosphate 3-phosphatidyltransferase [Puniceicoccus vermicola]MBC2600348.1 CDP-diacylglycerol--glycerol-3-phosphate 3-phosphatidyltransferase [Puniceicoccus vermicola]
MSLPNLMTLSRIPFLFIITVCLLLPSPGPILALIFFIIAALTDWADGWIARRSGMVSDFGKLMDALADKILMVGMLVVVLSVNLLPTWTLFFVLLTITREFWITGLRLVAAARGVVLAAEKLGKYKTVFQIISIAFLLLSKSIVVDFGGSLDSGFAWFCHWAGILIFLAAAVLTIVSGTVYLWKYRSLMGDSTPSKSDNA